MIVRADRAPDHDRGGHRDAERHHERQARDVEGDLVAGQRDRPEPAHEQADDREHAHLEHELKADRQPEPGEAQERRGGERLARER
jgi:hypothetical protein